jgi:hypothetical protein
MKFIKDFFFELFESDWKTIEVHRDEISVGKGKDEVKFVIEENKKSGEIRGFVYYPNGEKKLSKTLAKSFNNKRIDK